MNPPTRSISRNSMAGQFLDLAKQFDDEANLWRSVPMQKKCRVGAGTLRAAATLIHQGTWDRDLAEAWRDAAKLTLRNYQEARRADQR